MRATAAAAQNAAEPGRENICRYGERGFTDLRYSLALPVIAQAFGRRTKIYELVKRLPHRAFGIYFFSYAQKAAVFIKHVVALSIRIQEIPSDPVPVKGFKHTEPQCLAQAPSPHTAVNNKQDDLGLGMRLYRIGQFVRPRIILPDSFRIFIPVRDSGTNPCIIIGKDGILAL